ncbi:MAG: hypothetical protein JRN52_12690 [Nitrososphaerota archaeon]|nr:hypothetical protein [Nitrososphaerota archaeon]
MSSTSTPPSVTYFLVILMLLIVLRIRRVINGTRVSVARTVAYSAYYVLFSLLVLSGSFFIGIPAEYFAAYAAVFITSMAVSYRLAARRLVYWRLPDGSIFAKGGFGIYLVYLAGLVLRILIGYVFIGPNYFNFSFGTPLQLGPAAIAATIATDLLLVFGVGLLFGRNMQIMRKYRAYRENREQIPDLSEASVPS